MPDELETEPLTMRQIEALRVLREDRDAPPTLEGRVVAALRNQGSIVHPPSMWPRLAWSAAMAVVAAVAFLFGRSSDASAPAILPGLDQELEERYAIFLVDGPGFERPSRPEDSAVRGVEYHDWGMARAAAGGYIIGDELAPEQGVTVVPGAATVRAVAPALLGMFVLRAKSLDDAVSIARTLPHLRYGGEVAVVPIVRH